MAVNDLYRASVNFTAPDAEGNMQFNLHFRTTTVVTPISGQFEANDIAGTLIPIINADYMPDVPDAITQTTVDVIGLTDPTVQAIFTNNQLGGGGTDPVAYRNAPVVKLKTGLRGRSFNGRLYLMATGEGNQDAGVLDPAFVTVIQNFMANIQVLTAASSSNEYSLTVYSPTLSVPGSLVDNLVTQFIVNPRFGTQKSRQSVQ